MENGYEIGMNKLREREKQQGKKLVNWVLEVGQSWVVQGRNNQTGILMKSSRRSAGLEVPWGPLTRETSVSPPSEWGPEPRTKIPCSVSSQVIHIGKHHTIPENKKLNPREFAWQHYTLLLAMTTKRETNPDAQQPLKDVVYSKVGTLLPFKNRSQREYLPFFLQPHLPREIDLLICISSTGNHESVAVAKASPSPLKHEPEHRTNSPKQIQKREPETKIWIEIPEMEEGIKQDIMYP